MTGLYLILYFYFSIILNKPIPSDIFSKSLLFSSAYAQDIDRIDEVFLTESSAKLKWQGIKYSIELNTGNLCDGKAILYEAIWREPTISNNCFIKDSEEFMLLQKINGFKSNDELIADVNQSEKIPDDKKGKIINILKKNSNIVKNIIFHNINYSNKNKLYAQSFITKKNTFVSLINRINILLIDDNPIGASKLVEDLFKMNIANIVMRVNWFYFKDKNYGKIFNLIKSLKIKYQKRKNDSHSLLMKRYFQLFLDNYGFLEAYNYDVPSSETFFNAAFSCPEKSEKNLVLLRNCLIRSLDQQEGSDLIIYKLRQMGDDSLDHIWKLNVRSNSVPVNE